MIESIKQNISRICSQCQSEDLVWSMEKKQLRCRDCGAFNTEQKTKTWISAKGEIDFLESLKKRITIKVQEHFKFDCMSCIDYVKEGDCQFQKKCEASQSYQKIMQEIETIDKRIKELKEIEE